MKYMFLYVGVGNKPESWIFLIDKLMYFISEQNFETLNLCNLFAVDTFKYKIVIINTS